MNRIDSNRKGLASLGRNEDSYMAHVAPGEMVVPPVITPETRKRLQQEMRAAGLSPDNYTVGEGMSINPITGLPEFGWLKKTFKSVVKVAKVVAPLAVLVPGIGTAFGAVLGGIGGGITAALGTIAPGLASTLGGLGTSAMTGIAGLGIPGVSSMAGGAAQGISGLKGLGSLSGMLKGGPLAGLTGGGAATVDVVANDTLSDIAAKNGMSLEQLKAANPDLASVFANPQSLQIGTKINIPGSGGFGGLFSGGGADGVGDYGVVGDIGGGITDRLGLTNYGGGTAQTGGGGMGGMGGLAGLAGMGLLGKVVYDDYKRREGGIADTPKVSMDQLGRYQLASDLGTGGTRGEFGLAPAPVKLNVSGGGLIDNRMYYAEGGIAELDMREGGESEGPGTGTSDDIPAMLSDGEFVMTAAATKGAGSFNVNKTKSGIELISGGKSSRNKGVENMRELMNIFEAV